MCLQGVVEEEKDEGLGTLTAYIMGCRFLATSILDDISCSLTNSTSTDLVLPFQQRFQNCERLLFKHSIVPLR